MPESMQYRLEFIGWLILATVSSHPLISAWFGLCAGVAATLSVVFQIKEHRQAKTDQ